MRLRANEVCPIHKSVSCCGREFVPKVTAIRTGVRRIEDAYHPRGYRELRSPAEMKKLLNRKIEEDLVPLTITENIGIIAYSPMERGLLTGKYFTDSKLKDNDHRNGYFNQFDLQKVKTLVEELTSLAHAKEASLSQLVLRWTTLQKGISIVLAGARNAEQAISNAKAMDFDFSTSELEFINQAISKTK